MRFGVHVSIAGALTNAIERAEEKGCESMQIFSRNPRGWKFSDIHPETAEQFRGKLAASNIDPVVIHMPYLPNLAAGEDAKRKPSTESLTAELQRAEQIGCPYIVTHNGKALGEDLHVALKNVAQAIDAAIGASKTKKPMLLLENTAGQGTEIGNTIEELSEIIEHSKHQDRLGICIDTCHAFAAGYNLGDERELNRVLDKIDELIGLDKLKVIHLNDAKGECGSHLDRHTHIGQGNIGREGFKVIVNNKRISSVVGILETPENEDGDDKSNLATIRSLVK